MDIQQTIAVPVPAAHAAAKAPAAEQTEQWQDGASEKVTVSSFSLLLQDLKQSQSLQTLPSEASLASTDAALLAVEANEAAALLSLDDVRLLDDMSLRDGSLHIESLVSQTQRLDTQHANLDIQDDRGWAQQYDAPLATSLMSTQSWGAQPQIAAGHDVATVAAGVQPALQATVSTAAPTAMAAASAVLVQAGEVAESVAQSTAEGLLGDTSSEGRVNLHGAWKLEDSQQALNPAFQRVMGQVEQWAAASAGLQTKPNERTEGGKSAAMTADMLAAGQGSGTRLTENAVQETQQAQDAAFDAYTEAPVQDMRFWLQGKQQRAEVVLEKDGQSVRVQVSVRGNEAHVTFKADQAQTRELLDASLSQLREMLQQQGVELTGVSVQADARGDQPSSGQGQRSPWEATPVQHGQVVVPVADAAVTRAGPSQGLDLYA